MTIANREGRDGAGSGGGGKTPRRRTLAEPLGGEGLRKKSRTGRAGAADAGKGKGLGAKGEADVTDLLAVSALESGIFPAITADAGADALLDVMVQEDLRAEREKAPAKEAAGRDEIVEVEEQAGGDGGTAESDRTALLKKEIEALLAGSPEPPVGEASVAVADAGGRPGAGTGGGRGYDESMTGGATVTQEELAVLLPGAEAPPAVGDAGGVGDWPAISAPGTENETESAEAELARLAAGMSSAAELARELAADGALTSAGNGAASVTHDPLGVGNEEDERLLAQAAGELEQELAARATAAPARAGADKAAAAEGELPANLLAGLTGPVETNNGGAPATSGVAPPVPESVAGMQIPVPVVILQPDEDEEEEASPGLLARMWTVASEAALMLAQLIDLPFAWIRGLDKHVIGVAAVIFFLSGCMLMLLAWWMGR